MKTSSTLFCLAASLALAAAPAPRDAETGQATLAHQVALAILREPAQRPAAPSEAAEDRSTELLRRLPLAWDESRRLDLPGGLPLAIARRNREDWFVGAVADAQERTFELDFGFLPPDRVYVVHLFEDHPAPAHQRGTRYAIRKVTSTEQGTFRLRAGGGVALWITADLKRR